MSVRHSAEEYPEHLNPFHSRKNSFKESIRGLRNTLVRSFRGHDKKRPEIRKRHDATISSAGVHPSRHTLSVIPRTQPYESPVPLPRSRFSERVPKEKPPTPPPSDHLTKEQNPFEEEDGGSPPAAETPPKIEVNPPPEEITPTPTERKRIRRRKKRAPIPPNANGPSSMNGSKWSLVSTDAEFSSACPSDYEPDYYVPPEIEAGKAEELLQLTGEIQKLTEKTDSSLNLSGNPETNSVGTERDTSFSETGKEDKEAPPETKPPDTNEIPAGTVKDKIGEIESKTQHINEVELGTSQIDGDDHQIQLHDNLAVIPVDDDPIKATEKIVIADDDQEIQLRDDLALAVVPVEDNPEKIIITDDDQRIQLRHDLALVPVDDNPTKATEKIIIDDHNNNNTREINVLHNNQCDIQMIDDDEGLNYTERQSIVFAYTKDGETKEETFVYRERRSISLSGSREELQNADDSLVGRRIEQFEAPSSPPSRDTSSPKVRKSIPTKKNLLG